MSTPALKALVLAGGKGTRLRPLTYAMAKQLVPVANKPILHYALDQLYQGGVRSFGIVISPETGKSIEESVSTWKPKDVTVTFILQDEPAGLAHAVKISKAFLQEDDFIMYLGDNLIDVPLDQLVQKFMNEPCDGLILLKEVENPSSFGVAELDANQQVVRLVEKPKVPPSNLALIGIYFFTAQIFNAIDKIKPSWRGELEITDAIQQLLQDNCRVLSHIHPGWWLDTGKKDDLLAANQTILGELKESVCLGRITQSTILSGVVEMGENTQVINSVINGPVRIGRACRIENVKIGPNTSIGNGCELQNCEIENSVILENCHIENISGCIEESLIGQNCKITGNPELRKSHKFLLADHSEIQVLSEP
jgi:glucose-1-phosphate thymidylyltransferase